MKIPARLIPLVEDGVIDEVMGQVKSGKEADVFVVRVGDELRCAKVYKEANNRSFRQAVQYQEGRKVKNSRDARAIGKRSRYGQREAESSWINAEVEALNTLSAAGLRVPRPFGFFDGVLIMELVVGEDGQPAPRLNDIALSPETAFQYHEELIAEIVRMLCAGIIHGDLSEFNVLVDVDGPVIIDLPQAVNAAGNNSAGMMFARDVDNMARYFGRFAPEILGLKYAKEIWALYEKGKLTPHVELTGQFQEPTRQADVGGVLGAIGDARMEHEEKQARKAGPGSGRFPAGKPEAGASPAGNRPSWPRDEGRGRPGQAHRAGPRDGGWAPPGQAPHGGPRYGGRGPGGPASPTGPRQGGRGQAGQASQAGPLDGGRGHSGKPQTAGPRDGGRGQSGKPPQAGPRDHGPGQPGRGPQAGPSGPRGGGNPPPGGGNSSHGGGQRNHPQGGADRNPPQAGDPPQGDRWGRRSSPGGPRRGR